MSDAAPLPADPLAPFRLDIVRADGDVRADAVFVCGPGVGRIKMNRTSSDRGIAEGRTLVGHLNAAFGAGISAARSGELATDALTHFVPGP